MMNLEKIKHPELKNHINMIYMHGENQNQTAINKVETEIKDYIYNKEFIISTKEEKPLKIPYANDGEYLVPIYTDEKQYITAMDYFSLNKIENKEYIIEKLNYFKKIKEDPNFLGYIVNIAIVSYIINPTLL